MAARSRFCRTRAALPPPGSSGGWFARPNVTKDAGVGPEDRNLWDAVLVGHHAAPISEARDQRSLCKRSGQSARAGRGDPARRHVSRFGGAIDTIVRYGLRMHPKPTEMLSHRRLLRSHIRCKVICPPMSNMTSQCIERLERRVMARTTTDARMRRVDSRFGIELTGAEACVARVPTRVKRPVGTVPSNEIAAWAGAPVAASFPNRPERSSAGHDLAGAAFAANRSPGPRDGRSTWAR